MDGDDLSHCLINQRRRPKRDADEKKGEVEDEGRVLMDASKGEGGGNENDGGRDTISIELLFAQEAEVAGDNAYDVLS